MLGLCYGLLHCEQAVCVLLCCFDALSLGQWFLQQTLKSHSYFSYSRLRPHPSTYYRPHRRGNLCYAIVYIVAPTHAYSTCIEYVCRNLSRFAYAAQCNGSISPVAAVPASIPPSTTSYVIAVRSEGHLHTQTIATPPMGRSSRFYSPAVYITGIYCAWAASHSNKKYTNRRN